MDEQYYYNCIDKAITMYWRTLSKARGLTLHTGDIEYVLSADREGPERIFNINLTHETIDQRLDDIITRMKSGEMPNSFLITPNTVPLNLLERLIEKGFIIDTSGSCMAMDIIDIRALDNPTDKVKVIEVTNEALLRHWVHIINTALFECEIMSFDQFRDIYDQENTRFYLTLYDDVPASASMTISEELVADLDLVATLKDYRKKGLASLSINRALLDLKDAGIETVSLRAEPDGIGLYKKMGFKAYCKRISASYV